MRTIPILMSSTERKYSLLAQTWTYWGCSTFSLQSYKEFGEEFKVAVGSDRNDGPRLCSTGWWWAQAHGLKAGSQFSWAGCLSVKAWVWWVFSILIPVGERRGTRTQTDRFSWGLFMHKSKLKSKHILWRLGAGRPGKWSEVAQLCLTLCNPMECKPTRLLCPWDFSRQGYRSGLPFPSLRAWKIWSNGLIVCPRASSWSLDFRSEGMEAT